ncbi:hypothetical protein ACHAQA_005480 [Verticillium albo-atrum]
MNSKTIAMVLGLWASAAPLVHTHTLLSKLYIDEVSQGDGTCLRMPEDGEKTTSPVDGLESEDMACGANGNTPAAFVCPAPAGATLTFEFRTWPDASTAGSIDASHVGPCSIYVKKVDDPLSDPAAGDGWVKIWHEGYDEAAGQWCVDKLVANNGLLSFELPAGLARGNYLVRSEILALHQAYSKGDPQYYVGCAQVYVEAGPDTFDVPEEYTVSIPGYVDGSEKGNKFDVWNPEWPYPIPGPKPYSPPAASSSSSSYSSTKASSVKGAIPSDCKLKNANWCGKALEAYDTELGCWAAVEACFAQGSSCYNPTPPTGVKNCDLWNEELCKVVQSRCEDGDFTGPPDVDLEEVTTPAPGYIPKAVNAGAADGSHAPDAEDVVDRISKGAEKDEGAYGEVTTSAVADATSAAGGEATPEPSYAGGDDDSGDASGDDATGDGATDDDTSGDDDASGDDSSNDDGSNDDTSNDDTPDDDTSGDDPSGGDNGSSYPDETDNTDNGGGLKVSTDGTCGGDSGFTCLGSKFGDCCSRKGRCGGRKRSCGCGCQSAFGSCHKDHQG